MRTCGDAACSDRRFNSEGAAHAAGVETSTLNLIDATQAGPGSTWTAP